VINGILIDKNILFSIILAREDRDQILDILKQFDFHFISTNTFVTAFYVLRKSEMTKKEIYQDLCDFQIVEIHKNDCFTAFDMASRSDDIEDCLELLTAKRNFAKFITSDKKLISEYINVFDIIQV
jgi:predicted nucleic-acid-binding protein